MNRLKELRQEKKLSQKEIALELQVPLRTYQRWENGESQIKPDKAQALADHFGVSVGYLLGYSEDDLLLSSEEKQNAFHLGALYGALDILQEKDKEYSVSEEIKSGLEILSSIYNFFQKNNNHRMMNKVQNAGNHFYKAQQWNDIKVDIAHKAEKDLTELVEPRKNTSPRT